MAGLPKFKFGARVIEPTGAVGTVVKVYGALSFIYRNGFRSPARPELYDVLFDGQTRPHGPWEPGELRGI